MAVTAIMSEQFPGNLALGILNDDNKAEDRFCDRFASLHCPSLDPGTGLCDLYLFRPLSCRMCGPPIQIGEYSLPPCHRCFVDAPEHEIEKCRVIPDPAGLEDMILGRLGKNGHLRGSTVVAFALATHL